MKSSSGAHYIALDHVRALAAFMVFTWHFLHATDGYPVPFSYVPAVFPLALLDEGHTGVALFMTLSGYLFATLLGEGNICYRTFLWNRLLRLFPLLIVVMAAAGVLEYRSGTPVGVYLHSLAMGWLYPTWPNGGWSIAVEFHYYLLLPAFLWALRAPRWVPAAILLGALLLRAWIYATYGEVHTGSYWTLAGRVDQFLLGMLAYRHRMRFTGRHGLAAAIAFGFALVYWVFDLLGGFFEYPAYPSNSAVWLFLPTLEGGAYGALIAWYACSFAHPRTGMSRWLARIGDFSYSIYLLHFFVVFALARFIHERVADLSNFYWACTWSLPAFLCMVPLGYLSFRYLEAPFLRMRKPYRTA